MLREISETDVMTYLAESVVFYFVCYYFGERGLAFAVFADECNLVASFN